MRSIEGQLFATGMDRQVYRRDGFNQWSLLTTSTLWPLAGQVVGFEAIDGFHCRDLYAVGWAGEIWHFDGVHWNQVDSPTNQILTDVGCTGDGNVYACGRVGLLLRGRGTEWQVLDLKGFDDDLWSVRWFNGRLYLSGFRGVYELVDDQIVRVDFGDDEPETAYQLSACDDALLSLGEKDVFIFDATRWTRIA